MITRAIHIGFDLLALSTFLAALLLVAGIITGDI